MDYRTEKLNELRAKRAAAQALIAERIAKAQERAQMNVSSRPFPAPETPITASIKPDVASNPIAASIKPNVASNPIAASASLSNRYGFKFFYINLDRAPERRERMEEQLCCRDIKFERVVAVDAAKDSLAPYVPSSWQGGMLNAFKAEIATTISHIKAIYQFYQSGESVGVILEDDAVFEYEPNWPYTLREAISGAPVGWEIMTLSATTSDVKLWTDIMKQNRRYHLRRSNIYSAVAYAITRQHAAFLLKRFHVVDGAAFACKLNGSVSQMQSEINIIGTGPHRFMLYPPAFTYPTENNSYIHPTHIQGHKNCKIVVSMAYQR